MERDGEGSIEGEEEYEQRIRGLTWFQDSGVTGVKREWKCIQGDEIKSIQLELTLEDSQWVRIMMNHWRVSM